MITMDMRRNTIEGYFRGAMRELDVKRRKKREKRI